MPSLMSTLVAKAFALRSSPRRRMASTYSGESTWLKRRVVQGLEAVAPADPGQHRGRRIEGEQVLHDIGTALTHADPP